MKLVFLTYDFPFPLNSGGKNRAYNLLKFAKDKNIEFFLISFIREKISDERIEEIKKIGVKEVFLFERKKLSPSMLLYSYLTGRSLLNKLYFNKKTAEDIKKIVINKKIDIIHFESFYTGFYMDDFFSRNNIKQIYGSENIEFFLYKDQYKYEINPIRRFFFGSQIGILRKEEHSMYRISDLNICVTEREKKYIDSNSDKKTEIIPNGIYPGEYACKKNIQKEYDLLFVGNFTYFPNIDAINFFIKEVLVKLPSDIKICIVGKDSKKFAAGKDKRIETFDYVDDIAEYYQKSKIFIFPIRVGGGTNFKIIEAMASGIPVVAMQDRVIDFNFRNKQELMISGGPDEFVENIKFLLKDSDFADRIAKAGREAVDKDYNWVKIGKKLNMLWSSLYEGN